MSSPATDRRIKLQVIRLPTREKHIFSDISNGVPILYLQRLIERQYGIEAGLQQLAISGVPPKPIDTSDVTASLASLGIRAGDSIELRSSAAAEAPAQMQQGKGEWTLIGNTGNGQFIRKVMAADNSCLFHAIAYTCQNRNTGMNAALALREIGANVVAANPQKFNTLLLGSPNGIYQEHILNPNSWGGAPELLVFSEHFQTEIVAFDPKALREDIFGGEVGYSKRVFLIYTGDHYDAMAFVPTVGSTEQVVFNVKDENAHARARDLIQSTHNSLVAEGKATKQTEWRHNKDLKRANGASRQQDIEREKRVREQQAKIGVSSAADLSPASADLPRSARSASSSSAPIGASSSSSSLMTPLLPKAEAGAGEWECETCTCINPNARTRCSACDAVNSKASKSAKPSPAASPALRPTPATRPAAAAAASAAPSSAASGGGFNCVACTAWNERASNRCSVCGSSQNGNGSANEDADAAAAAAMATDDDIPTPVPQREDQLIGGADDAMLPVGGDPMFALTPQQREILSVPWNCPRCTMYNEAGMVACGACGSPHPHPSLSMSPLEAAAASSSSSSNQPKTLTQKFKAAFKSPPPWKCERCGKSQSSQLWCCGNCKNINMGLQMRMQEQANGGGGGNCSIM